MRPGNQYPLSFLVVLGSIGKSLGEMLTFSECFRTSIKCASLLVRS